MKKSIGVASLICVLLYFVSGCAMNNAQRHIEELNSASIYYARCNLKVIDGNKITWVNWQSSPTYIPAGTKVRVIENGQVVYLLRIDNEKTYTLNKGAKDSIYTNKFISKSKISIDKYPNDVIESIKKAVAREGMTKEQVYISMGPPVETNEGKTNQMTYEEIMNSDLWIYARRRFGKNIGVGFDPISDRVNRTEGVWR